MTEWENMLLVGLVVFVTYCLQGISGFGGAVLALPFMTWLVGLKTAVPVLVLSSWLMGGYVVLRSWRSIRWGPFAFVAIHVAMGLPVGMVLYDRLPENPLKIVLAAFMAVVGLHGLITMTSRQAPAPGPGTWITRPLMSGLLALGGVMQGVFGTGGPFVVIYATKVLREKALFRVTLCLLWLLLNPILLTKWTLAGDVWSMHIGVLLAIGLPFVIAGTYLGDVLHHRVDERLFRMIVYVLLVLCSVGMFYSVA